MKQEPGFEGCPVMADKLIAFADESVRVNAASPMYLIAATIIPENMSLTQLEEILPKGASKLHWRDLGVKAQRESLSRIAGLEPESTIVVASPIDPRKQERARRKVLEVLLPLLESRGIAKLIMESRFPSADAKDAALYRSMRKKGLVSAIDIDFANPAIEHRLWVPDQILGAFSDTTLGLKPSTAWQQEWDALKGGITVIEAKP